MSDFDHQSYPPSKRFRLLSNTIPVNVLVATLPRASLSNVPASQNTADSDDPLVNVVFKSDNNPADNDVIDGQQCWDRLLTLVSTQPNPQNVFVNAPIEFDNNRDAVLLGSGSFGAVYKARQRIGDGFVRPVAVKVVRVNESALSTGGLRHLNRSLHAILREVRKLYELRHPNVVKLYTIFNDLQGRDVLTGVPTVGFVMEYAHYGCLHHIISRFSGVNDEWKQHVVEKRKNYIKDNANPLPLQSWLYWIPVPLTISWLTQLTSALAHIHSLGNQHKDIKPLNILIRQDLTVMIGDFGATSNPNTYNSCTAVAKPVGYGTMSFLAPERRLQQWSGPISDMFSFGVTAYILLTQEHADDNTKSMVKPDNLKNIFNTYYDQRIALLQQQRALEDVNRLTIIRDNVLSRSLLMDMNERISSADAHAIFSSISIPDQEMDQARQAFIAVMSGFGIHPDAVDVSDSAISADSTVSEVYAAHNPTWGSVGSNVHSTDTDSFAALGFAHSDAAY